MHTYLLKRLSNIPHTVLYFFLLFTRTNTAYSKRYLETYLCQKTDAYLTIKGVNMKNIMCGEIEM